MVLRRAVYRLALAGVWFAVATRAQDPPAEALDHGRRLAVVVPTYRGDLERAVASLGRWPSRDCSPLTQQSVDLVLYYGEGEEDREAVDAAAETVSETAGRCFAATRTVYAHVAEEDDVYPKGPSVMFYKMFLDEDVRSSLSEYDALSILEWDVLVASDRSFEQLYHAAFRTSEEFWVKGSNLEGTNFHSSAEMTDMWHVLGHINGNAIYNNNDQAFVEYVDYTRSRWQYDHPYDVALWLTISDFPYSWPLYQRYSNKFVVTNLISYVGYEHVNQDTVSDAVAGQTLFIHGRSIEGAGAPASNLDAGSSHVRADKRNVKNSRKRRKRARRLAAAAAAATVENGADQPAVACSNRCGVGKYNGGVLPVGTSTVCDATCAAGDVGDATFSGLLCGAGDPKRFGNSCRLCYVDVEEARAAERRALRKSSSSFFGAAGHMQPQQQVVMCDTMRPPEVERSEEDQGRRGDNESALLCSDKCSGRNTICDSSCGTGLYGDYNCGWKNRGSICRYCFDDHEAALLADQVASEHGGRVIMCSTLAPPNTEQETSANNAQALRNGGLPKWITEERWKTTKRRKLQGTTDDDTDDDDDEVLCDSGCEHTSSDGTTGRVCDPNCSDPSVYGTLGCSASEGIYGPECRVCYNDIDTALSQDTPEDRAIMCSTVLPVDVYARRLSASPDAADSPRRVARKLESFKEDKEGARSRGELKKKRLNDEKSETLQTRKLQTTSDETDDDSDVLCESDCEFTSDDGTTGRVCDPNCSDPNVYGTLGCSASEGIYGSECRVCFNDIETALAQDSPDERAIMCSTVLPLDVYARRLSATANPESASRVARMLDGTTAAVAHHSTGSVNSPSTDAGGPTHADPTLDFFEEAAERPFTQDLKRGNLCGFIAGRVDEADMWEVTAKSILEFVPGMRVAIAAEVEGLAEYERLIGGLPGVTISSTQDAAVAGLFADKFCGHDTSLILYIKPGSVVSRSFTSKDTHSPQGDLLVVYSDARGSYQASQLARRTALVLGFEAPSFTHGTDLMLPASVNEDLRELLGLGMDGLAEEEQNHSVTMVMGLQDMLDVDHISAVPQLLAAFSYSRSTPGVWFLDPQGWVSQYLFKEMPIWAIPLVKPRYTCAIPQGLDTGDQDIASVLQVNLDFFARGGKCENGIV